ncbi:MAG: epoxyqueuosine reductase QueH [Candidatus Brocadiia bacterium]
MPNDPLLVHACCAPCLCALLGELRARERDVTAFFHNPNIHPFIDFRRRLKACQVLAERERLPLIADTAYGLEAFLDAVGESRQRPARCRICYTLRLEATAACAARRGFPAFTSTLLASPQQDRSTVCAVGHAAARRHGVVFEDADWRALHEKGLETARRLQLYRQQYCGCIFSEHERYRHTTRHLYRPQGKALARDT